MIISHKKSYRNVALLLCATMTTPLLAGCGGKSDSGTSGANLPAVDDTRGGTVAATRPMNGGGTPPKTGMSTGKKVAILAGAAALYYMYKRSQNKKTEGAEGKYYLSKNGRVYYRDATGQAHYVTAPAPIEVPQDEINQYPELNRYKGYNNQNSGEAFGGV